MAKLLEKRDENGRPEDEPSLVDYTREYEARWFLRTVAERRLKLIEDDTDPLVQLGRPTGP